MAFYPQDELQGLVKSFDKLLIELGLAFPHLYGSFNSIPQSIGWDESFPCKNNEKWGMIFGMLDPVET
jgi:hypothetical protein